ncbi:MAG TPA: aldolase [Sphingomonas sp.]|jgi:serine kinase of HPr protein (carbohydrate metabolism regulator)|uniref:HPr kinase/phosphorylase n=1 Tax=Sphingomonas sp. TaxID=28214 RepID=UPI002ED9F64B
MSEEVIHATTVAIGGRGVLISGPSGSGKSDLALRLIDRGAVLVADDRTRVRRDAGRIVAGSPDLIAGKLEVRGLGIWTTAAQPEVTLSLCVALGDEIERLPISRTRSVAGIALPELLLDPRPASAPIKVELMLANPEMVVA